MDPKYFILILFCGHLNDTVFSETEASTTKTQPPSTLMKSLVPDISPNSQNSNENSLDPPTQSNNVSSGQPISPTKVTAGQTLAYNITRQPITTANTSSQRTVLPAFTSNRKLPPSGHTSTRQLPQSVYSSPQPQSLSVHTSSRKPIPPTLYSPSTQATPTIKISSRHTPGFILETTSKKNAPRTNANSTAAVLIGVILTSMLIAILMIVLWKYFKKPVSNDQNWAGRSPFADGETPDLYLDNIREKEVSTKRTSVISLNAWKPSKSTILADDLEIKLFESSENTEDSNIPNAEKLKVQINGTSEDSADRLTIGTAISSSDDADLPAPPPPLLDLEGQDSNQLDKPTMTTTAPLPNDSTNLPPPLDCLTEVCEDHTSEYEQSLPPPPDSLNLLLPPTDFMKNQEDSNNETQCQEFAIVLDLDQDLNESLPLPPEELL
ncbi:protein EVI2B [Talpa occidentalis]|uniref:protein EVI2B n=1 Tax=Talpa occidentalis TaxID=50954 RepID=UPI001890A9B7|nr:protein EVI2B [Talpa occidentalis]